MGDGTTGAQRACAALMCDTVRIHNMHAQRMSDYLSDRSRGRAARASTACDRASAQAVQAAAAAAGESCLECESISCTVLTETPSFSPNRRSEAKSIF